jgi:hypothetical protein
MKNLQIEYILNYDTFEDFMEGMIAPIGNAEAVLLQNKRNHAHVRLGRH